MAAIAGVLIISHRQLNLVADNSQDRWHSSVTKIMRRDFLMASQIHVENDWVWLRGEFATQGSDIPTSRVGYGIAPWIIEGQQYWASTSLRKATLPYASSIWQRHRDAGLERTELLAQLSDRNYSLKLENENTKLHLGRVWRDFPVQASRGLLQSELIALDSSAFAKFEALDG